VQAAHVLSAILKTSDDDDDQKSEIKRRKEEIASLRFHFDSKKETVRGQGLLPLPRCPKQGRARRGGVSTRHS
jgi:hypothetical protein